MLSQWTSLSKQRSRRDSCPRSSWVRIEMQTSFDARLTVYIQNYLISQLVAASRAPVVRVAHTSTDSSTRPSEVSKSFSATARRTGRQLTHTFIYFSWLQEAMDVLGSLLCSKWSSPTRRAMLRYSKLLSRAPRRPLSSSGSIRTCPTLTT